ncbi:MAG: hypothetical protein ACLPKB_25665 [Xanthobacteraceae bacterium]
MEDALPAPTMLGKLLDLLERGPIFRVKQPPQAEEPPTHPQLRRLTIMDDIREMTSRVPINESLAALLRRLSADEHDTLMDCLASDVNSLLAQVTALTGRTHLTGADVRRLILRWRMTIALADDPVRPPSYAPRSAPRARTPPPTAPVDEARLERDMAEPEG